MGELTEFDDGELVAAAMIGDGNAFGELVRRYRRVAFAVALSITARPEDAEDTAQEAFLVALRRLEDCRDPDRFGGWFLTIVRNLSKNLVRRESIREGEQLPFSIASTQPGPEVVAERSELRRKLVEVLATLSEVQRDVVLLHDVEGWKHREIAEKLGMPSGTVRSHLHYARKILRERLDQDLGREAEERTG